jgi:hypothetical protein
MAIVDGELFDGCDRMTLTFNHLLGGLVAACLELNKRPHLRPSPPTTIYSPATVHSAELLDCCDTQ